MSGALVLLAGAAAAAAQQRRETSLGGCVDRVLKDVREEGATPYGDPVVDFLLPGDQRIHEYALPREGCFGFIAVGHRGVQHLGLTLYAESGRVLARDPDRDAHAYARFCGEAGRRLVVELRMLDGQGEVQLVPLWRAPKRLRTLDRSMQDCTHAGSPRPGPVDVGPEPRGPPIDAELLSVARRLSRIGYRLEGGVLFGGLPERKRETRRIVLEGDRCYALAAVGDSDVEDIDLRLLALSDRPVVVAADTTRRRDAVVKVCPEESGLYVLDVRMYQGAGNYVIQAFGLIEPTDERPVGMEGGTRIPYAEMNALLAQRGLRSTPYAWAVLRPGEPHSLPIDVQGGRCYGIGAVPTPDFGGADLDLSLLDDGGLRAADIGPNPSPVVYHCAAHDGVVHAVVRGHELRRPGRVLLVLAADAAPTGVREGAEADAP
ncbi:MAG: hypothetical protein PVI30_11200 [Myxococcales bacterium]|jgi:hypothetical protein